MSEVTEEAGFQIVAIQGSKATDDGRLALIGTLSSEGQPIAIAVDRSMAWPLAQAAILATRFHFPYAKMKGNGAPFLEPNWFEAGKLKDKELISVTFALQDGAAINFALPPAMALHLADVLQVAAGAAPSSPAPETPAN